MSPLIGRCLSARPMCLALLIAILLPCVSAPLDPTSAPPLDPAELNRPSPSLAHKPQVCADVLMVSLPQASALTLLPMLRDPAQIGAAQKQILAMIGRKEADLIDWPEITTHSGTWSVTESYAETRFPIPYNIGWDWQLGPAPKITRTAEEQALCTLQFGGALAPLTQEVRNTGHSFDLQAVVSSDGSSANLVCTPLRVRFVHLHRFFTMPPAANARFSIAHPIFSTDKVTASITLRDGERRLIHVGKHSVTPERMELFILGLRIIPAIEPKP